MKQNYSFNIFGKCRRPIYPWPNPPMHSNQGQTAGVFMSVRQVYKSSVRETFSKAFQFGGTPSSVRDVQGSATIPNEVLNLVKNIVGAGALALPGGVAAFANAPSVLFPAAFWLVFMAAIFGYYFLLLGRTCKFTGTSSYAEAWERTMGEAGSGFVAFSVALKAGMGNLECSIILADSFQSIRPKPSVERLEKYRPLEHYTRGALATLSTKEYCCVGTI